LLKKCLCALAIAIMSWQGVTGSTPARVSRSMVQNVHTTFSFPNPLSESEELQSWGCSKIFWYHSWCDSTVIFDQTSNSSNVDRFWAVNSLIVVC
jgi:hypothetical protein